MKRKVLYYILSVICLVASSCVRDDVDSAGGMSEGECIVSAAVDFKPLTAGLDGGTRTAGDAVKSIDNLCVLFYDNDNKLVQTCYLEEGEGGYTLSEEERTGSGIAERTTPRATFRMKVAYGSYRIYVAANMGDLSAQEKYAEAIKTVDGLKSIRLAWDEAIADNREMFGFFGSGDQSTFEAPAVVIDSATTTMQAWIRRCVSKLTVAYDATGLKDNVAIYIHSVQIRDIPAECYLGQKNTPSAEELIAEGEMWEYEADAADRLRRGIYLSNGPNTSSGGSDHGEKEAASLFFFENMQDKEGPLKWQDKTGNNSQVSYPDSWKPGEEYYKDNVAAGTYVEVKGYYVSDNPERIGHGEITYRFMLGKDVDRNYEAERNHHYKLTLIFNGFANDIDWHIEYIEPDPGVYVKSPQYISYIYDRTMNVNIKVVGKMIGGLHAEILENHWWPDDADNTVYYQKPGDVRLTEDATGFLSLKRAWRTVLGAGVSWQNALDFSKNYYYDNGGDPRYIREYVNTHGSHDQSSLNGGYSVRVEEDVTGLNGGATRTFTIPLYTRARSICPTTGYTGNNVYTGYQRTAKIRFYADIEYMGVTKTYADTVEIHQVHRMVNPKGIWRSADNSDPFEVKLMYLDNDKATSFTELISEGPWYAEIASGDWFTLQPVGQSVSGQNGTVMGGDRTKIEFKYVPDGAPGGDNVRCGVIRVYYHNNTCVHLIFVRQGYAPLALKSGEANGIRSTCRPCRWLPARTMLRRRSSARRQPIRATKAPISSGVRLWAYSQRTTANTAGARIRGEVSPLRTDALELRGTTSRPNPFLTEAPIRGCSTRNPRSVCRPSRITTHLFSTRIPTPISSTVSVCSIATAPIRRPYPLPMPTASTATSREAGRRGCAAASSTTTSLAITYSSLSAWRDTADGRTTAAEHLFLPKASISARVCCATPVATPSTTQPARSSIVPCCSTSTSARAPSIGVAIFTVRLHRPRPAAGISTTIR